MDLPISLLIDSWSQQLQFWALDGAIRKAAAYSLRLADNRPELLEFESALLEGDFSVFPPIELLPASSMPGAAGAYAASTGTIYLNQGWLNTATEEQIQAVLTEELGHFLDARFNVLDTPGDEGELFSKILNQSLRVGEEQRTRTSDDQISIIVDGEVITAEASQFSFPQQAKGTSLVESSITALEDGSSLITGRFLGTASFGDIQLTSNGSRDVFVAKLDDNGLYEWATKAVDLLMISEIASQHLRMAHP